MASAEKHKTRSRSSNARIESSREYGFWITQFYAKRRAASRDKK